MFVKNRIELQDEIKNGRCSGCYLLFSSEFFLVEKFSKEIIQSVLSEEFLSFNFCEFDALELQFDELQNFLNTVPVMAKFRVALIKNFCYFGFNKSYLKKLEEIFVKLPKASILIITVSIEDFDFKKNKKFKLWLNKFSRFVKAVDCGFSSKLELFNFFFDWVIGHGSKISQSNFDFLVRRVSNNWQIVFRELEKLCAYAYGREILRDDILNLTEINLNFTAFELAGAILNFECEKALKIFKNLVELDVNLFLVLGAINACFVDLFRVSVCAHAGLTNAQIIEIFNYKGCEFKIRNARKYVERFKLIKIKHCVRVLLKLDLKLKTTTFNKVILIEKAIVDMITGS